MWNAPSPQDLAGLPKLYATEALPWQDKVIHEHYFLGGSDWYAAEYSPADRVFFGYAILGNDMPNAEWGYFSLDELRSVRLGPFEIDRDLHWKPMRAGSIDRIVEGMRTFH